MTRTSEGAASPDGATGKAAEAEPPPASLTDFGGDIVTLSWDTPAAAAMKAVHGALLPLIVAHEDGTRRGLEGDYLHDFRVAVRRTRTGLRQIKKVFPKADAKRFSEDFAWLGDVTGPARDLEVYLGTLQQYAADQPQAMEAAEPFVAHLRERRTDEQESVRLALESARYRQLIDGWGELLRNDDPAPPDAGDAERGGQPIGELATQRIHAAHRQIIEMGTAISDETPPVEFHRLRLRCKKLRYLLEFFRGLFHEAEAVRFIQSLKGLQDNLGDLNDLRVQRRLAIDFEPRHAAAERRPTALVGLLESKLREQRDLFPACFATFSDARIGRLFKNAGAPDDTT